ncbi:MAG: patatin-like phospholipase family protein [Muribaculaceae bacterium]|nr:patatin-like phospholipase family protein [Muribaculaceae bacterium]
MEIALESEKEYEYGLALSGGGARGFAHVGVLKALEERGINPGIISGVSAGSVVAVLYSAGFKPDDILKVFANHKFSDFAELSVPKDGFFKIEKFNKILKKALPVENIEDLIIPTLISATDIDHGCTTIFRDGPIVERVAASCSIPIIFKPVKINGINYVDGGVLRNLPAWTIRKQCKHLIGVNCSPFSNYKYKASIIDIAQRCYDLMSKVNVAYDMKLCDTLILTKDIAKRKVFDIKCMYEIAESGYNAACNILDNKTNNIL